MCRSCIAHSESAEKDRTASQRGWGSLPGVGALSRRVGRIGAEGVLTALIHRPQAPPFAILWIQNAGNGPTGGKNEPFSIDEFLSGVHRGDMIEWTSSGPSDGH